jgi:hypothetical protein
MGFQSVGQLLSFLERPEVVAAVASMALAGLEHRRAAFTRRGQERLDTTATVMALPRTAAKTGEFAKAER